MNLERKVDLYDDIKLLLESARQKVLSTVNSTMTMTYFLIGKRIVEEDQNGEVRAEYGKELIKQLSIQLTSEFGKGFTHRNLELMRKFYIIYSDNQNTKSMISESKNPFKLSWTHYVRLIRLSNKEERSFYEIDAEKSNWTVRELDRQIDSALYERLVLSRDKEEVKTLSIKGQILEKPKDIIKDPYILEFLGLNEISNYSENTLETAIISHIEKFIMELGKGFLFQGRQVRFTFDEEHFFVDLVFYNRILKCFVLIDLKIGKLKHQDLGQMQMYVNYYDRFIKLPDENKTIGIIICKDKNDTLVEITLPEDNTQIFASRYMTILPSKESLVKIVEEEEEKSGK